VYTIKYNSGLYIYKFCIGPLKPRSFSKMLPMSRLAQKSSLRAWVKLLSIYADVIEMREMRCQDTKTARHSRECVAQSRPRAVCWMKPAAKGDGNDRLADITELRYGSAVRVRGWNRKSSGQFWNLCAEIQPASVVCRVMLAIGVMVVIVSPNSGD